MKWHPGNHLLAQGVEANKDASFEIEACRFNIKAGSFFHTGNCFKYPVALFEQAVKDSCFTIEGMFHTERSSMRLAVLKASP